MTSASPIASDTVLGDGRVKPAHDEGSAAGDAREEQDEGARGRWTAPTRAMPRAVWRADGGPPVRAAEADRVLAEETPVALTYARATHAVMLATPADLEDFAVGFSLTEGIADSPADIEAIEIVPGPDGIEARMDLAARCLDRLTRRQRRIAGPSGCGLCGMDSLAEAVRPLPRLGPAPALDPAEIMAAMAAMQALQTLNAETRAVHAAAFLLPGQGIAALREDVGRHNALDKLVGALARARVDASRGAVLLSSRVSVEMVQKTVLLGAPVLVAVSAPTALAVRTAAAAGLTLIGVARRDGFEVFSAPERISSPHGH